MNWIERINQIINTLDRIVVSGRYNFSRLLLCCQKQDYQNPHAMLTTGWR